MLFITIKMNLGGYIQKSKPGLFFCFAAHTDRVKKLNKGVELMRILSSITAAAMAGFTACRRTKITDDWSTIRRCLMLPGFHCADDEAETLVVMLKDAAAQVLVELYYGVFETFDLITRAVRVINQGTEPVRLY